MAAASMKRAWVGLLVLLLPVAIHAAGPYALTGWAGETDERYDITIDSCQDFTGDGKKDIKVTVTLQQTSDGDTEDCRGVAFDIADSVTTWPAGLDVTQITLIDFTRGSQAFTAPAKKVSKNNVQGNDLDFNMNGDASIKTPFDIGVSSNGQGAGDGTVRSFSFVLFAQVDIDAATLLSNTDWYVRTQSTSGLKKDGTAVARGLGSAKTTGSIGVIPACPATATCGDADGAGNAFRCPTGFRAKSGVGSTVITTLGNSDRITTCCEQADTCGDADGAGSGSAAFPCLTSEGLRPKTTANIGSFVIQGLIPNDRKQACCEAANTCGDADGAGGSAAAFACTGIYKLKNGVGSTVIQDLTGDVPRDTCCERMATCSDPDGIGAGTTAVSCANYNTATTTYQAKPGFATIVAENNGVIYTGDALRDACCNPVLANPTCDDDDGSATANTNPVSCTGNLRRKPNSGNTDISTATSDADRRSICCEAVDTCGDPNGGAPGPAAFQCPLAEGLRFKTAANTGSVEIEGMDADARKRACCEAVDTCGDANGGVTGTDAFQCPQAEGLRFKTAANIGSVVIENKNDNDRKADCCERANTCGDADGAGGDSDPFSCPPGYKPKTGAGVSTTVIEWLTGDTRRDACCDQMATCSDPDGAGAGTTAVVCATYNTATTTYQAKPGFATIVAENNGVIYTGDVLRDACCNVVNPGPGPGPGPIPTPTIPFAMDKTGPGVATAGTAFAFTITVSFTGAASGVTVTDTMQAGLAFTATAASWVQRIGGSRTGGCLPTGTINQISCNLGDNWLAGNVVEITVPAVAATDGVFSNTATIQSPSFTATDAESVTVTPAPPGPVGPSPPIDLIVSKRVVGASTATLGSGDLPTFNFEVKLTAAAGTTVPNPTLVDTMGPAGLAIQGAIGASNGGTCTQSSLQAFSCSWFGSTITPGTEFVVSYTAVATQAGTFTNKAESKPFGDQNLADNEATVEVTVTAPQPGPPVLEVTKTGPSTARVGQNISFLVTAGVAAGSPSAALLVLEEVLSSSIAQFVLPLPDPTNCALQSPQRVRCSWNNVAPADTKVLQFTVKGAEAGTFTNKASVSSTGNVAPKEATVDVTLQPETVPPVDKPTIKLEKSGPGKVVNAGEEFDFTLTASVLTGTVTTMTLTDPAPAGSGIRYIKATPAAPCDVTDSLVTCVLTAPFPQTIKLTAVGSVKGEFKNTAILNAGGETSSADAPVKIFVETCGEVTPGGGPFNKCPAGFKYDSNFAGKTPANAFTCCSVSAQSAPDMTIRKTVNDAQVNVGNDVIFTITVKHNKGLQDTLAQNVVVTDTLPVGLKPYTDRWSVTPSVGDKACTFNENNPRQMTCTLGSIPAGESRTIAIPCLADGSKLGRLTNTATVGCDKPGQEGVTDPLCSKTSNTVPVTVINPKPPGPCVSSLAIDITPSPKKAAKGSLITWAVTLTPRNGSVVDVNVTNPIPSTLSTPTVIRQPAGGRCSFVQSSGQQMLQCAFANISTAVTVQYTTRANVAGGISNTAEAKYKACRNTQVVITIRNNNNVVIWEPVIGSCCDKDFGCTAGVARGLCTSRGGTFTKDLTACFTGRFCTGACCNGGGSLTAQCLTTTKEGCPGGKWDPTTTCFDQNYCPKPCLSKCQECSTRNDTCCPGFSCRQSGKFGKTYCLPDCTPNKPVCGGAGALCGLVAGGSQCCKGLDCIVGKDGAGVCAPRDKCKPRGSTCGGYGECAGGLFCALNGKCEIAACNSKGKKFPRSASAQTQKNVFHYQCQAFFDGTMSGPQ